MTHLRELLSRINSKNKLVILSVIITILLLSIDIVNSNNTEIFNESIEVYFCGVDNCPEKLSSVIIKAKKSIDCSFYDLDNEIILNALNNQSSVSIRLILEKGNFNKNTPQSLRKLLSKIKSKNDSNPAYMHNKFCIIDDRIITTGSFNPTDNDAFKNDNNLEIIESKKLANNYEDEFDEMWSGIFGKGQKTIRPHTSVNNITIVSLFCPDDLCSENIVKTLETANHSINFMTFSFTDQLIANSLVNMLRKNITITGIIEKNQANVMESRYEFLRYHNVNITFDKNRFFMHHKAFIVDDKIVITGSMNPTNAGNLRNDENVLIIYDENIAEKFRKEFEKLYSYPELPK